MSNPINSIVARSNAANRRKFLAKGLMIAFALFGIFLFSGEAKAQTYLPIETQIYLDVAQRCLQRGDARCALLALQKAARISPQLARDPELVQLARWLQARVGPSVYYPRPSYPSSGGYRPRRDSTLIEKGFVFGNPYLNNK